MSILSTNQKLVKVGQEYSAGSGISIDDYVISYTGDVGKEYSAGENIGINDYVISSRNWSPDITYAAESAFQRATGYTEAQISALSGEVSDEVSQLGSDIQYISGVALTSHQSLEGYLTKASGDEYYQPIGSYATISQLESTSGEIVNLIPTDYVSNETLEQTSGNIVNLIPDTSEFITNASAEQTYQPIGNYLSSNALEGYATQQWVGEQGYLTGVSIPESATWQDVSTTVQTNSAQWAEGGGGGGDPEVNDVVHSYSADGTWLVANDITGFQEKGDYYSASNPSGFLVPNDISNLASISLVEETSGSIVNLIPDTSNFITNVSAESTYQTIDGMTAYQPTGDYATESFVQNVSADITSLIPDTSNFITNSSAEETYQTIAGMTAYQPTGAYITLDDFNYGVI